MKYHENHLKIMKSPRKCLVAQCHSSAYSKPCCRDQRSLEGCQAQVHVLQCLSHLLWPQVTIIDHQVRDVSCQLTCEARKVH